MDLFLYENRIVSTAYCGIMTKIFFGAEQFGFLRIGELPTAQAFVDAEDLIFADIGMGKGSKP